MPTPFSETTTHSAALVSKYGQKFVSDATDYLQEKNVKVDIHEEGKWSENFASVMDHLYVACENNPLSRLTPLSSC